MIAMKTAPHVAAGRCTAIAFALRTHLRRRRGDTLHRSLPPAHPTRRAVVVQVFKCTMRTVPFCLSTSGCPLAFQGRRCWGCTCGTTTTTARYSPTALALRRRLHMSMFPQESTSSTAYGRVKEVPVADLLYHFVVDCTARI